MSFRSRGERLGSGRPTDEQHVRHHRSHHHKDRERSRSPSTRLSSESSHQRRRGEEVRTKTSPRRSKHGTEPSRHEMKSKNGDVSERPREERRPLEVESEGRRDAEKRMKREERRNEDEEAQKYSFGEASAEKSDEKKGEEKEEPNFGLSGKLTAETNSYKGVVIKYSEPPEARQPSTRWRLYQFKGEEVLYAHHYTTTKARYFVVQEREIEATLYIHRQSAYLIGRDRRVVDLPVDHPSCSSQHAVLQYRLVQYEKKDGSIGKHVRPYIIDLESTNGTYINNQRIEPARFVELKEKDMIKFGFSSREYVMLHENSKEEK